MEDFECPLIDINNCKTFKLIYIYARPVGQSPGAVKHYYTAPGD